MAGAAARQFDLPVPETERLKAGMAALERLRDELEASLKVRGETIEALEEDAAQKDGEIGELKAEISGLEEELSDAVDAAADIDEHVTTLARVRTKIRGGQIDDGLYDLEVVLSHLDSAWRTRA